MKRLGPGKVYVLSADQWTKVGTTTGDPRNRTPTVRELEALPNVPHYPLSAYLIGSWDCERASVAERLCHVMLQEHHAVGEWFEVSVKAACAVIKRVLQHMRPVDGDSTNKWLRLAGMSDADADVLFKVREGKGRVIVEEYPERYRASQSRTAEARALQRLARAQDCFDRTMQEGLEAFKDYARHRLAREQAYLEQVRASRWT